MKIVQINITCGSGSTGKICISVSNLLTTENIENYILYVSGKSSFPYGVKYASDKYIKLQALKSRIFGNYGFNSQYATKRLIKKLDQIKPDIVHLHNLHGHNCNLTMLFSYLKEQNIKLFWTFHDCWAFTAYCPHFTMVKCDKWKKECHDCPQLKNYSWFFDRSKFLFKEKKNLFQGLNLTIITPSQWLADLVKQSFLKDYPVKVINNGIDLSVFKPTESRFREKNGLIGKKVVLGVAFGWGVRKGLDVFIELAHHLPDNYRIVLVGTNDNVDKRLPANIISIHRTQNQKELAEIYTAADVFANPTREEVLGLVNVESLACGTPVVTFRTGGSPECIDETCGSVVDCDDIDAMEFEIRRICEDKPYSMEACLARSKKFDMNERFEEYVKLYKEIENKS
jgi:glycosyltransferase involved in cell wall biosynthesis